MRNPLQVPGPNQENRMHAITLQSTLFSQPESCLETDEEKADFEALLGRCTEEWRPQGLEEELYTEEIAILYWKLGLTEGVETEALSRRQEFSGKVDGVFQKSLRLPISDFDLPLARGWDCERLVIRAVSAKNTIGPNASLRPAVIQNQVQPGWHASVKNQNNEAGHLEVEAILVSSLTSVTRYRSPLKRDLYKAIEMLRAAQRERRERER
jgi:hypothetical protein